MSENDDFRMHRLETRERPVGVQLNDRVEGGEFSRPCVGSQLGRYVDTGKPVAHGVDLLAEYGDQHPVQLKVAGHGDHQQGVTERGRQVNATLGG